MDELLKIIASLEDEDIRRIMEPDDINTAVVFYTCARYEKSLEKLIGAKPILPIPEKIYAQPGAKLSPTSIMIFADFSIIVIFEDGADCWPSANDYAEACLGPDYSELSELEQNFFNDWGAKFDADETTSTPPPRAPENHSIAPEKIHFIRDGDENAKLLKMINALEGAAMPEPLAQDQITESVLYHSCNRYFDALKMLTGVEPIKPIPATIYSNGFNELEPMELMVFDDDSLIIQSAGGCDSYQSVDAFIMFELGAKYESLTPIEQMLFDKWSEKTS